MHISCWFGEATQWVSEARGCKWWWKRNWNPRYSGGIDRCRRSRWSDQETEEPISACMAQMSYPVKMLLKAAGRECSKYYECFVSKPWGDGGWWTPLKGGQYTGQETLEARWALCALLFFRPERKTLSLLHLNVPEKRLGYSCMRHSLLFGNGDLSLISFGPIVGWQLRRYVIVWLLMLYA